MVDSSYEPYWTNYLDQFDLSNSFFELQLNTNKHCLIIEPRKIEILVKVIKNFMYLLKNKGWGLIVVHGIDNEEFIKSRLSNWKNVIFINMNEHNLTIPMLNRMLTTSNFWKQIKDLGCDKAVFFQSDALLLKDNVDDYIHYDYVGAPWHTRWLGMLEVGNGGFSLRDISTMIEITSKYSNYNFYNEDIYFSYHCMMMKKNIPSLHEAMKFSMEGVYYNDPIGLHQPALTKFNTIDEYINLLSKRHVLCD